MEPAAIMTPLAYMMPMIGYIKITMSRDETVPIVVEQHFAYAVRRLPSQEILQRVAALETQNQMLHQVLTQAPAMMPVRVPIGELHQGGRFQHFQFDPSSGSQGWLELPAHVPSAWNGGNEAVNDYTQYEGQSVDHSKSQQEAANANRPKTTSNHRRRNRKMKVAALAGN